MATIVPLPSRVLVPFVAPPIQGHVTDTAGRLTSSERLALDAKLDAYRKCSDHEVAVLVTGSLGGESIEDVAYATFDAWHLGRRGADDGVLLLLAPTERKTRIETGKGVGGALTDVQSSRILREKVNPHLAKGEFFAAIDDGTQAVGDALGGCAMSPARLGDVAHGTSSGATSAPPPKNELDGTDAAILGFSLVAGVVVVGFIILRGAFRERAWLAAFPFAFVPSVFAGVLVGAASDRVTFAVAAFWLTFLGVFVPLVRFARRRIGGGPTASAASWSGAGGVATDAYGSSDAASTYASSYSSSSSSSDCSSSDSSYSSSDSGGSGFDGGGGTSGGGGASEGY